MPATILVVDDDPDSQAICELILKSDGYRVLLATDGEEALRILGGERCDAMILDLSLPGIDGWEVAERLRADPGTARLPVIFYTAHGGDSARDRGVGVGCAGYLVKPCSPRAVLDAVERCLSSGSELPLPSA